MGLEVLPSNTVLAQPSIEVGAACGRACRAARRQCCAQIPKARYSYSLSIQTQTAIRVDCFSRRGNTRAELSPRAPTLMAAALQAVKVEGAGPGDDASLEKAAERFDSQG